jgi:plastocyanin
VKARWLVLPLLAGFAVPFVVPALADNQSVSAEASSFDPKFVAVKPGEKVTWSNIPPSGPHNVKFDDGSFEMPDDSQQFTPWTVERTFETPGEYRYHCEVHGGPGGVGMSGIVYVNDAGTVPTQTQTQPTNTTPTNTGTTPTNTTPTNTTGTNTTTTDPPPSIASVRPGASTFCTRRSRT